MRTGSSNTSAGAGIASGHDCLKLAAAAMQEPSLRDVAHPALERLAAATGESAQLYVTSLDGRVCVDAVESSSELRTFVPIGDELPLWAGSAGKVFLASMLPEQAERTSACACAHGGDPDGGATPPADRNRPAPRLGRERRRTARRGGFGQRPCLRLTRRDDRRCIDLRTDVADPSRRRQALRAGGHDRCRARSEGRWATRRRPRAQSRPGRGRSRRASRARRRPSWISSARIDA